MVRRSKMNVTENYKLDVILKVYKVSYELNSHGYVIFCLADCQPQDKEDSPGLNLAFREEECNGKYSRC